MKALTAFAFLIILLGIMGPQNAAANCADKYEADYHSLFLADIDHPCPNSYTYAEYNLYGEGDGDFDLYVLDSWNDTWYSGSGSWSVCSPQVTFGEGFRQIADSDTAPDAAEKTTTTTTTTGSINPELVGRWILTFDWDCDGNPGEDEVIFNSDGSFGDDDNRNKGEWSRESQSIRWEHDKDPKSLYRGSISGLYMSGTMSTIDGSSGCWTARKAS
ncbi:MAG: hypothetical protein CG440_1313 [Methanosaeta sp. NSM2]|nr:hypothetical protein [Methanothrix sp.]OYV12973.1 MAG: hypothetical protein CG440_1313 [Methanosaeta sp. NSM2]